MHTFKYKKTMARGIMWHSIIIIIGGINCTYDIEARTYFQV